MHPPARRRRFRLLCPKRARPECRPGPWWPGSRWARRISSVVRHMAISRRIFLRNSAIAMAGVGSAPLWLERAAFAGEQQGARKKVLVAVFQRGAADGLNIVVPHGEQRYYDLRPTISIPRPSSGIAAEDSVVDLDGFF